jgi:hypothetical protein
MYAMAIKAIEEKWKDAPPQYENLSDTRQMEWCLAEELRTLTKDLRELADLADKTHTDLVQGLQYNKIETWLEVAEMITDFTEKMGRKLEAVRGKIW